MAKEKQTATVIRQECIATDIYSMWIRTGIAKEAVPGQFISVYLKDPSKLLPRPISICDTDGEKLRIVYRVAGEGTKQMSAYRSGDTIDILGPLGNGFPLEEKRAMLIGGGIGIPPMLALAKALTSPKEIVLGFRNELFLTDELKAQGNVSIATEDGSTGTKGTVMDAIRENGLTCEVIYACGPIPMLRAIKAYAKEHDIHAWISMEERMACGIGACLGCVCSSTGIDDHSQVRNKRICADGPVFNAEEVDLS
ncbi:MAG: dihydroorotate dehydrogenase electron transfer subunit [Lachnospiraceae bacterium]|nr:dihydroorotate dehydrogenase electron transfer subunit [Lachnospiraceae bacterium]